MQHTNITIQSNIFEQIKEINKHLKNSNRYYIPIDPQEAYDVIIGSKLVKIDEDNIKKVLKIQNYIFYRISMNKSRVDAFKMAFPDRCKVGEKSHIGSFQGNKDVGDELSDSTILVKAKRIENSLLYKKIFAVYGLSVHIAFATDRFRVIQSALEKSLDDSIADRDRVQYMKVFLEETRKPQEANDGITINIGSDSRLDELDNKLSDIAKKLEGKDARTILATLKPAQIENKEDR